MLPGARLILLSLLIILTVPAFSQQKDFGSWNVINTRLTLSSKWGLFNELQLRSQSFYSNHFYHEVKGGISYAVNKNFSFLLGIGKYITYTDGGSFEKPVTSNETRFWQQLTMNHYLERLKFEHRYRVEQRWYKGGNYRNRFRYRLNTALPVNHNKMQPGTFYIAAFNEIFLTNTAPYFERNRFFVGPGYQISKYFTIQPGYVYQFDYRNYAGAGKHFFQLTLMIELDAHKNPHEKIPGNVD
jgi:hypothetical protein